MDSNLHDSSYEAANSLNSLRLSGDAHHNPLPVLPKKNSMGATYPAPPAKPRPTLPPKPDNMRGSSNSNPNPSQPQSNNNAEPIPRGRNSLFKTWDGTNIPTNSDSGSSIESRATNYESDSRSSSTNSSPSSSTHDLFNGSQPKQGQCVNCGSLIMYTPSPDGVTHVKCYLCPAVTQFEDFPTQSQSQWQSQTQSTPNQVPLSSSGPSSPTAAPQSTSAQGEKDANNKKKAELMMKGAFKSMKTTGEALKAKAKETQTKVANSQFYADAKEKATVAAQKTKALTQKASEQTKVVASKARENLKENIATIQHKMRDDKEHNEGSHASAPQQAMPPPPSEPLPTAVFGVPVDVAVERGSTITLNMPDIITKCIHYLHTKGVKEEGIFRLSGGALQIRDVKDAFNRGEDYDLSTIRDEHVVSGLLKLWFRELPETILTRRLIPEFKALEGETEVTVLVSGLSAVINKLPNTNKTILENLLQLLNTIVQYQDLNKMSVVNLAIVFSPTLGCPMEVMKHLITHYDSIFHYDLIDL